MSVHLFIDDVAGAEYAVEDLLAAPRLAFDIETTGLDPRNDRVCLVQFATEDTVYIFDVRPGAVPLGMIRPILEQKKFVGQNLRFDFGFMKMSGLPVPGGDRIFDTMIAHSLLHAGEYITADEDDDEESEASRFRGRHDLATIARECLGVKLDKTEQKSNWEGELTQEQLEYAARDVEVLLPIFKDLGDRLIAANLVPTMKLEMRLLPAVVWIETAGVRVNVDAWRKLAIDAASKLTETLYDLNTLAGDVLMPPKKSGRKAEKVWGVREIKWSSPAQLLHVFKSRGFDLPDTTKSTLKELAVDDDLAAKVLEFRYVSKRATTYGEKWIQKYVAADSRVYSSLNQVGAEATGRTSSSKPNMQQIPKKKEDLGRYRACFIPREGFTFIRADYSQIEPRIMAEFSKDAVMLDAFKNDQDVYIVTAAGMYGKSIEEIANHERQIAKITFLGYLYGMWWKTFRVFAFTSADLRFSAAEAEANRNSFFTVYKRLAAYHTATPKTMPETRTRLGRRRLTPPSKPAILNSPVQGTAADVMKLAMVLMYERRDQVPSLSVCLSVHDEVVAEVAKSEAEKGAKFIEDCMTEAFYEFLYDVPCKVDVTICSDWSGAVA